MTLIELYESHSADCEKGERSSALLEQTHWFTVNVDFDPRTGEALPQGLSTFLSRITQPQTAGALQDRLWRITEHARNSIERVFKALNESPRREQALLPVRSVRELDANSFIKLSNRPGRNIREKLAHKPYLYAVRRFQSVDLPENRLLKEYVTRLAELLEQRCKYLREEEDELLPKIQSWLLSDEAQAISRWENLPPNNALLSHREYRRIWDSWRWLQTLDDDINNDFNNFEFREKTMNKWIEYGKKYSNHLFADMPVFFDYEEFNIRPWTEKLLLKQEKQKIDRYPKPDKISQPVCVDFSTLYPCFSSQEHKRIETLRETYIWQRWKNENESLDINLFNSDALYLHQDSITVTFSDLLFSKKIPDEFLDRAAFEFVSRFHKYFLNDKLIWLVPDFLNDFELNIVRRNINARFPDAEPLPRSIAAVFAQDQYINIIGEDYSIIVIDIIGGKTCVTKLIARLDPELEKRVPETLGYYWERCPPVIIGSADQEETEEKNYDIVTVDENNIWHSKEQPEKPKYQYIHELINKDKRIGKKDDSIIFTEEHVMGGIRMHALRQKAGDIPLWRDHIPELSIKVMKDGLWQPHQLVSRNNKLIVPIRGKPVRIPIPDNFTLYAGKQFYKFSLIQGENNDEIDFEASLKSSAFPLKSSVKCCLNLTFTYGDNDPYCLTFEPLNKEFLTVRAEWTRKEIITDAPAPQYPTPLSWDDLKQFPNIKAGEQPTDLLEGIRCEYIKINKIFNNRSKIAHHLTHWCRFLIITLLRDGRSISTLPNDFRLGAEKFLLSLDNLSKKDERYIPDIRFLESCFHRDAPSDCIQWIKDQVNNENITDVRAVGFALGDVSQPWQEYIFKKLLLLQTPEALRVFAYAIWREQHFIEKFKIDELELILDKLKIILSEIKPCPPKKDEKDKDVRNWVRATAEPLELLLGLLRTRDSSDHDIKMILQPHQKITKEFSKLINNITYIIEQSNVRLFSRVKPAIKTPEGEKTLDLLPALSLFLAGHDTANAISIAVSDDEKDND